MKSMGKIPSVSRFACAFTASSMARTPEAWEEFLFEQHFIPTPMEQTPSGDERRFESPESLRDRVGKPATWWEEPVNIYSLRGGED
jgi:hypothetical protein